VLCPVFDADALIGLACNRAHHADVGGQSGGSMTLSTEIYQEGFRIPPVHWMRRGREIDAIRDLLLANVRTPRERLGDLRAQLAANQVGGRGLTELVRQLGRDVFSARCDQLLNYAERLMRSAIAEIPDGRYTFADELDDDGVVDAPVPIRVAVTVNGDSAVVDFEGTSPPTTGCVNCPAAVTRSATYYVFVCLAGDRLPHNEGMYRPIEVRIPHPCLLDAVAPAAVVAGNVETSQRVVDVVLGALAAAIPGRIPAASAGTMNSLSLSAGAGVCHPAARSSFTYYETVGGGSGASASADGESGVQTHMTNTRNTPAEALEMEFPLRVRTYAIEPDTGGAGRHRGGDGLRREIEALVPMTGTMLADRRRRGPYGLAGGGAGRPGRTEIVAPDGSVRRLNSKDQFELRPGDRLRLITPGGGGYGSPAGD
jgi:N-methylhydantoinase B